MDHIFQMAATLIPTSVKDVDQHDFVKELAAFLKRYACGDGIHLEYFLGIWC